MRYNLQHIQHLLLEKATGTISEKDNLFVEKAIAEDYEVSLLWEDICRKLHSGRGREFLNNLDEDSAWQQIEPDLMQEQDDGTEKWNVRIWLSAAASIVILLGIGLYYFMQNAVDTVPTANNEKGIRLKLADGRTIGLDESAGSLIDLGAIKLNPGKEGLSYTHNESSEQEWSTLVVPVGGDYKIVLSDGSEIWLNAASSLRFPFNFPDSLREVYLEGEAYFKVEKNQKRPFIVHAGNTAVRVLGTSFNISAYPGDAASTSLVEGSVLANTGDHKIILKPGFQATFVDGKGFLTQPFDRNAVLSWIGGVYYFHDQKLSDIVKTLQRWFDVNVVFQSNEAAEHKFTGTIEKGKPLQVFISNLKLSSSIHIELKEKTIYIR